MWFWVCLVCVADFLICGGDVGGCCRCEIAYLDVDLRAGLIC